jgi:hypothetical protein
MSLKGWWGLMRGSNLLFLGGGFKLIISPLILWSSLLFSNQNVEPELGLECYGRDRYCHRSLPLPVTHAFLWVMFKEFVAKETLTWWSSSQIQFFVQVTITTKSSTMTYMARYCQNYCIDEGAKKRKPMGWNLDIICNIPLTRIYREMKWWLLSYF